MPDAPSPNRGGISSVMQGVPQCWSHKGDVRCVPRFLIGGVSAAARWDPLTPALRSLLTSSSSTGAVEFKAHLPSLRRLPNHDPSAETRRMLQFLKNLFNGKPKVQKLDIRRRFELIGRVGQGSMSRSGGPKTR